MSRALIAIQRMRRLFLRGEDGSVSVEAVLWVPVFFSLLALIVDASVLFSSQDRMLRAVHDASRAYATGRFANLDAAEDFIRGRLGSAGDSAIFQSSIENGMITMQLTIPASEIAPIGVVRAFTSSDVTVSGAYLIDL